MSVPATLTRTEAFHPLVSHLALSLSLYPIDIIWVGRKEGPEGICGEIHCGGSEGDKLLAERERKWRLILRSIMFVHLSGFFSPFIVTLTMKNTTDGKRKVGQLDNIERTC